MRNYYRKRHPSARVTITLNILKAIHELGEATLNALHRSKNPSISKQSQTISVLLHRLTKQGLITRSGNHHNSVWRLTSKGQQIYRMNPTTIPKVPPRDDIPRIVIFDIPEHQRAKRHLLRQELAAYNYEPLQKSVWIGYNPLPDEFLKFIDELDLAQGVHIFKVSEKGTIN